METNHTKLIYLEDMAKLVHEARVESVLEEEGKTIVILNETIFYPQGGGQPYDQGTITSGTTVFKVEEVRFIEGVVRHIGRFEQGSFVNGDTVSLAVDPARRALHARLHSGGHVVDMAVQKLSLSWNPGKGYHFSDGPYVEYDGVLDEGEEAKEKVRANIEAVANEFIEEGIKTSIKFMPKSEMYTVCLHVPDYLPEDKPARVVLYGTFGVPCGGTHVANLKDIGHLSVRKVSVKKGVIRVGYDVERS